MQYSTLGLMVYYIVLRVIVFLVIKFSLFCCFSYTDVYHLFGE